MEVVVRFTRKNCSEAGAHIPAATQKALPNLRVFRCILTERLDWRVDGDGYLETALARYQHHLAIANFAGGISLIVWIAKV